MPHANRLTVGIMALVAEEETRSGGGAAARAAVVDLRLADGLDGRDVLLRLRAQHPGMPVVATTGFDPKASEADLRGLGGPTLRLGPPSTATPSWSGWPACSMVRPFGRRRAGAPPATPP